MDRFSKICVVLITVSLAFIAMRPFIDPEPVRGATKGYDYSWMVMGTAKMDEASERLAEMSKDGVEVYTVAPATTTGNGTNQFYYFLRKPRP